MARRIIPKNLKTTPSLKFYDKDSDDLCDRVKIIDLCFRITTMLQREHDASSCKNLKSQNGNRSRNDKTTSGSNKDHKDAAPCRKHDEAHQWKDCPDIWHNKSSSNDGDQTSSQGSSSSAQTSNSTQRLRGEVKSAEIRHPSNGSPMVCFDSDQETDDDSACSSHVS